MGRGGRSALTSVSVIGPQIEALEGRALLTPSLSIDDVTVQEGDAGQVTAVFHVTLSGGTTDTVTVDYATVDDTAQVVDNDYQPASGTLTFMPPMFEQWVNVSVNGDTSAEADETFYVNLSNAANATIDDGQGVGTIQDDDTGGGCTAPDITIDDVTVNEADGTATFTVNLSAADTCTVTVDYATTPGTATDPADYLGTSGTLTFAPGTTSLSVTVTIIDDSVASEPDETFYVDLSNASGGTITDSQGVGTIQDNDTGSGCTAPDITIDDVTVNEGAGTATFTVSLSAADTCSISVDYGTTPGSATDPADYTGTSGTLTFAPGTTSLSVTVTIIHDTTPAEPDEDFFVNLSNAVGGTIMDSQGVGTIQDNDACPFANLSMFNGPSVTEGNSGTINATWTVSSGPPSPCTVTVDYGVWGGGVLGAPATAGVDFDAVSGTLTFPPGSTSQSFEVPIHGDTVVEPDERYSAGLSNPVNAAIVPTLIAPSALILNDDSTVQFTAASQSGAESVGTLTITAQLSATSPLDVTVPFTVGGTATEGATDDFTITGSPVTISAGSLSTTITINVHDDALDELNETVVVTMGTPTNATLGTTTVHTATITDNDAPPTVEFTAASQSGDESVGTLTITAQLSAVSGLDVTLPFTVGGTATAGTSTDFTITGSPVTIAAGSLSATITITVNDDGLDELDETVVLTMGTPTNATLGTTTVHTATITDNDDPPTVEFTAASQSGDESVGTLTITAQLSTVSGLNVTVPFTVSGTATEGPSKDFTITASPVTILAGALSATIALNVNNEALDELDETVVLTMGAPTNATLGTTTMHTATITDNDAPPTVAFNAASQSGDESIGTLTITAQLSAVSGLDVTVPFTVAGTATEGATNDFTITGSPVTIAAGSLSATITITVNNDVLDELAETLVLTMGTPTNATLGTTIVHTATITDNDAPPTVEFTAASQSGDESIGTLTITAQLLAVSGLDVTVPFTVAGMATEGATDDFTISTSPLMISAGASGNTITITVNNDTIGELDETVVVTMGTPTNATPGTTTAHTATILDDDPPQAVNDSYNVDEDVTLNVAAPGVLANDSADALIAVIECATTFGSLTLNSDGSLAYTPNANFNGTDSFTYHASDGVLDSNVAAVTITVNAVNDPPQITSAGGATVAENVATVFLTVTATDAELDTSSFSIVDPLTVPTTLGVDGDVFSIDSVTGGLAFTFGVDYENPIDADSNNVYLVEVKVEDGNGGVAKQVISVTVTDANDAPIITSGPTASVPESTASVAVTASDQDGDALTFSITGGADGSYFDIDSATGTLTFVALPNFEAPADANGDNVYIVQVTVTDGSASDVQLISITVTDVNEHPYIANQTVHIPQSALFGIADFDATDPDIGQTHTYSMSPDGTPFSINATTGVVDVSDSSALQALTEETSYPFTVTVVDTGTPPLSANATLIVIVSPFAATLTAVDFLDNHPLKSDPTPSSPSGEYYPDPEWERPAGASPPASPGPVTYSQPVAYSSGSATTNRRLKVTATFKVSNNWTAAAQVRASGLHGYSIPATPATPGAGDATTDDLTVTAVAAIKDFAPGPKYYSNFELNWEISINGGLSWVSVGTSTNPLYLTFKQPSGPLFRTVVHIGSTNAAGITAESGVISAIWGEFSDNSVGRWDGTGPLYYNHKDEADFDPDRPPSTTSELLVYGHGQCDSWASFFVDVLRAQGVSAGTDRKIVPTEQDGFLVNNWIFGTAGTYPDAPAGYNWANFTPGNLAEGLPLGSQGFGATPVAGTNAPGNAFDYHRVVDIGGEVYDPSYGARYNSLAAWEAASVAGLFDVVHSSDLFVNDDGRYYAKQRTAGATFVEWEE